jgi:hypothetical protein
MTREESIKLQYRVLRLFKLILQVLAPLFIATLLALAALKFLQSFPNQEDRWKAGAIIAALTASLGTQLWQYIVTNRRDARERRSMARLVAWRVAPAEEQLRDEIFRTLHNIDMFLISIPQIRDLAAPYAVGVDLEGGGPYAKVSKALNRLRPRSIPSNDQVMRYDQFVHITLPPIMRDEWKEFRHFEQAISGPLLTALGAVDSFNAIVSEQESHNARMARKSDVPLMRAWRARQHLALAYASLRLVRRRTTVIRRTDSVATRTDHQYDA